MKRKNNTTASRLVCLAAAIALAAPAWASQPVAITNAGFEAPAVADGAFTTSAPPGWVAFNHVAGDIGVWNPEVADYPAGVPEGLNVFYVYFYGAAGEEGVSQVLSGTPLQADASYTLSVRVGSSNTYTFPGYKVQLLADGTVLAEDDNTQTPAAGTFATATVTYTYNAGLHAALVGKPLEIRLLGKGLVEGEGEGEFDDVKLDVTLANPIADPGGPYSVMVPDGSLSLDGSGSLPSDGQTIALYQWDLDNDGDFDELVTGVTPAAIPYPTLTGTYGMALGLNTIKLRVTDSAAKTSTVEGIVEIKSRTLVHEDWQTDPLLAGNTVITTQFPGWTATGNVKTTSRTVAGNEIPGDSSVTDSHGRNQVIYYEYTTYYMDYNIAHNWSASDKYYLRVEASPMSWSGTSQRYIRPALRQQDGTVIWQTPENATTAVPLYNSYMNGLTDYPSELTFFFEIDASTFSTGTEGQPIQLRIATSGARGLYVNKVTLVLGPLPADTTPPAPDPLTWDILPTVSNFTTISMRIGSARDPGDLYGVEYYFENLTNSTNSGWQNSREWVQTGLAFDTEYTYRVKARDKSPNQNETTWSASQSATTLPRDLTPPSPDPLTWDTAPTVADFRWITMSVSAATDPSGVEYYFENVTKGTNSGWIAARAWTEKDLNPATSYTYRAKARDKSLDQNESTTWSTEQSATTPAEPANTLLITRFQDPLIPNGTGNPNLGNWVFGGGDANSIKMQWAPSDGLRTDTDLATTNQAIQFEWAERWLEYNIPHNWSSTDTFILTLNASPQQWSGESQRYVRPSLRQQNGTVLWAPGENMSGPERTAVPLYSTLVGSSYQDDPNLSFSYTIPASAFTAGAEGQPIRIRIGQSGGRGLYLDNVHLSVSSGSGPTGYAAWATGNEPFGGDANGDGVKDGIAFLLGAANPGEDASGRLPTVTKTAGGLVLTFNCLPVAARGGASLKVEHSSDLGELDPWTATADVVPDVTDAVPDNNVTFVVGAGPVGPPALNRVSATIGPAAAAGGKLFGRLRATE